MAENYTAEDFAQATLATRSTEGVARRVSPESDKPWRASWIPDFDWLSDEEMAAEGWVPVVESRITERTLRDSQEKAARKREKLVDHIADQDRVIRRRNDEITALRERVRGAESGRLSLARLEAAWEAAEQAGECREGDVLIIWDDEDNYLVRRMDDRSDLDSTARILSRAPKREPWVELAGVLHDEAPKGVVDVDHLAERLHVAGVRVTDGGE